MDFDQWMRVAGMVAPVLHAVCWPVVVLFVVLILRKSIKRLLEDADTISFGTGAFGGSISRRRLEATAWMGAATAAHVQGSGLSLSLIGPVVAQTLIRAISSRELRFMQKARLLWVDADQAKTYHERRAIEALGATIDVAQESLGAAEFLGRRDYDVTVGIVRRTSLFTSVDAFVEAVSRGGQETLLILYVAEENDRIAALQTSKGVFGVTRDPNDLLLLIVRAVASRRRTRSRLFRK